MPMRVSMRLRPRTDVPISAPRLLSSRLAPVPRPWPIASNWREEEMTMSSTLSLTQSRFAAGRWVPEPPDDDVPLAPTDLDQFRGTRPPLRKRASRVLLRFLTTFGIGIAATLGWQSYG